MLDLNIKKKLLSKLENLIAEKKESETLKVEFVNWFNSGEPFFNVMNESEKRILEKYPNLVIKKCLYINLHSSLRWCSCGENDLLGPNIFSGSIERNMLDHDSTSFYIFNLTTYPAIFDTNYSTVPLETSNKQIVKEIGEKLRKIIKVRKRYLEKREFIKRVLDSRELTLTELKNNYKDLYDLL